MSRKPRRIGGLESRRQVQESAQWREPPVWVEWAGHLVPGKPDFQGELREALGLAASGPPGDSGELGLQGLLGEGQVAGGRDGPACCIQRPGSEVCQRERAGGGRDGLVPEGGMRGGGL